MTARAVISPLAALISRASLPGGANMVATRMASDQNGLPGGWPIWSEAAVTTYSGQSQYDAPRSMVSQ